MTDSLAGKTVSEFFVQSAEFYDILSEDEWRLRRPALVSALKTVNVDAGPVLDIGSGSGRGVELIGEILPSADIIAVEPSAVMRICLMSRLMANSELRQRTTIFHENIQDVKLPERLSAVFFLGTVGFLDKPARQTLWQSLAEAVVPGGLVFVDVMMIDKPQPVSDREVASVQVGHHRYEMWMEGTPVDDAIERWTVRYQVRDTKKILRSFKLSYGWFAFGLDQIASEAAEMGFQFAPLSKALMSTGVLRRMSPE